VLVMGDRRLLVKDDMESLTTTKGATGINFFTAVILDSSGMKYTVPNVTDFDRPYALIDLGTSAYRIFLELKSGGKISLAEAQSLVKAIEPAGAPVIDATHSIPELIQASRTSWEWR
jgi:hypothetical protein